MKNRPPLSILGPGGDFTREVREEDVLKPGDGVERPVPPGAIAWLLATVGLWLAFVAGAVAVALA